MLAGSFYTIQNVLLASSNICSVPMSATHRDVILGNEHGRICSRLGEVSRADSYAVSVSYIDEESDF